MFYVSVSPRPLPLYPTLWTPLRPTWIATALSNSFLHCPAKKVAVGQKIIILLRTALGQFLRIFLL